MLALVAAVQPVAGQTPPPTLQALSKQADAARDGHQLDKAIKLYQQALKLKPDWDEGWWNLGSINYDLDRYSECAPAFRRLAALKPDSAPAWTMAGLCEYKLRRFDGALEYLAQVDRLKFQEPPELAHAARLHYALVLTKAGAFEKSIGILTELTRVDRKSPEIVAAAGIAGLRRPWLPFEVPEADRELVFKLGDAMATAMEFDAKQAVPKFEELVQQYASEPNVHFRFGAFLATQDPDRGIAEIKKALALAPEHILALVGLATICLKREEVDEALGYAKRAVQAAPADFSAHVALGRVLLAKEDAAHAAVELEQAVKLSPGSIEARYSLASAYSRLGRKDEAARELAEFKRLQSLAK
jgi:tetratricopeptide (TPR) repeat protein